MKLRSTKDSPRASFFCDRLRGSEQGFFIPLVAMMLFALVAVVGLAVDGGHLQQARLELQKAADAAAVAAAKKFALVSYEYRTPGGSSANTFITSVRSIAGEVVKANLIAAHGSDNSVVTTSVELDQETVKVSATWNVGLFILGHFPGYTPTMPVRVIAKAQVRKAMTSLIIDTSNSMKCPAQGTDCTCLRTYPFICNNPRAIHVVWAVQDFASLFNPTRDMFDITWFSVAAKTDLDMCNRGSGAQPCNSGGFNYDNLFDHANSALLGGNFLGSTNTCDGLFRSYVGTFPATLQQHRADVARVLLTDGAPAAARFFFSDPLPSLPVNDRFGQAFSTHDYYNWAMDWISRNQFLGIDSSPGIPGVTALGKASIPFAWVMGYIPNMPPSRVFPPDPADSSSWYRQVSCSAQNRDTPTVAFSGCLRTFGFKTPDNRVWGNNMSHFPFSSYREQYFHCAIAMADFLRRQGSIVYGIALGATPPATSDPYQNLLDDSVRKDCFMLRIANDPQPEPGYSCAATFPYEFKEYTKLNPTDAPKQQEQGKYLFADDADNLYDLYTKDLYPRLARKLKTAVLVQ